MINQDDSFQLNVNESAFLQIRLALNLSRRELGEKLGVDPETVGNWEIGKRTPRLAVWQIKQMDELLKKLGLTWIDLPDNVGPPGVSLQYKRTKRRRQPPPE